MKIGVAWLLKFVGIGILVVLTVVLFGEFVRQKMADTEPAYSFLREQREEMLERIRAQQENYLVQRPTERP